jgi:hypothetical protein
MHDHHLGYRAMVRGGWLVGRAITIDVLIGDLNTNPTLLSIFRHRLQKFLT